MWQESPGCPSRSTPGSVTKASFVYLIQVKAIPFTIAFSYFLLAINSLWAFSPFEFAHDSLHVTFLMDGQLYHEVEQNSMQGKYSMNTL